MIPPVGHDHGQAIERARYLEKHHVDAINIPDAPRSSANDAISLAILLEKSTKIESLAHYTCRDKNLLGMQADLLGAYALGLHNLLVTTGDPHQMGDYLDVTTVFDVDSIGLTNMVQRLNQGVDVGGKSIGKPTGFVIGVGANAGTISKDAEDLKRFTYKVQAGAEFALTQPVFDASVFERSSAALKLPKSRSLSVSCPCRISRRRNSCTTKCRLLGARGVSRADAAIGSGRSRSRAR
jgi:homocysteine S-methyltransferase